MDRQKALTLIKRAVLQLNASRDPSHVRHIADLARSITIPRGDEGYDGVCSQVALALDCDTAALDPVSRSSTTTDHCRVRR